MTENSDAGPGSLRSAIEETQFIPGPHLILLEFTNSLSLRSALPTLVRDCTIASSASPPPIISVTDTQAVLRIASGFVTLSNVNFSGCIVSNAPVILNNATLTLQDCLLEKNQSTERGSGGGILYSSGNLQVLNCRFAENSVTGMSGDKTGSPIGDASMGLGGAIYIDGGSANIADSQFFENRCRGGDGAYGLINYFVLGRGGTTRGGSIYVTNAEVDVQGSTFYKNVAQGATPGGKTQGGAIYAGDSRVTIQNCRFIENGVSGSGTVVSVDGNRGGDESVGGALYSYFSESSVIECEFRANWAYSPMGVRQGTPLNRSGAMMVVGHSAKLSTCTFSGNYAFGGVKDIGGPIRSGGSNFVEDPGGATGFSTNDVIPNAEILTRIPRFEWVQTNRLTTMGLTFSRSGNLFQLAFKSAWEPNSLPERNLITISPYGSALRVDPLGYDRGELFGFFQRGPNLEMYFRSALNLPTGEWFYGDFAIRRDLSGRLSGEQFERDFVLVKAIEKNGSVYRLSGGYPGPNSLSNPILTARKIGKGGDFVIQLGSGSAPAYSQRWTDTAVDDRGNWYLSGILHTNTSFAGFNIPKVFLMKVKPDNGVDWVISRSVDTNFVSFGSLHTLSDGLLTVDPLSRWQFIDSNGAVRWTKEAPAGLQVVDDKRDAIYVVSSTFIPPFHPAAEASIWSEFREKILYCFDTNVNLQWAARLFGQCKIHALTVDSDGNLLIAGMRQSDFALQNENPFKLSLPLNGFLAKLSTDISGLPRLYSKREGGKVDMYWSTNYPARLQYSSALPSLEWANAEAGDAGHYYRSSVSATNRTGFFRLQAE